MKLSFIDSDLWYTGALWGRFDSILSEISVVKGILSLIFKIHFLCIKDTIYEKIFDVKSNKSYKYM